MAQLVERVLGKDEVGGSNPPSSSKKRTLKTCSFFLYILQLYYKYVIIIIQKIIDIKKNYEKTKEIFRLL